MKKKTEFKKLGFAAILIYAIFYITVGRISEICGIVIDTNTDVALIYMVLGAFVAYCTASASDKHNISRYGYIDFEKGDGTE